MIRRKWFIYSHLVRNWYRRRQATARAIEQLTDDGLLDRMLAE